MKYLVLVFFVISMPAMAQIKIDDGIRSPNLLVAGDSVIDELPDGDFDDAEALSDPEIPAPAIEDVDAFTSMPAVPTPRPNVKRVVKSAQEVKIQRSIADDRIDDSYVQGLLKRKYDFTNPID